MKKSEKQGRAAVLKFSEHKRKRDDELEADIDALFQLPLAEFTGARNALAARLKKSGRANAGEDASQVKALVKPSVSAWAVNQLYWTHREAFERLLTLGERFHKAQTSRSAGKVADMREALDARRETLTHLSNLATALLRDASHNPSPDTVHRVTTTLEAMSAYAARSDAPRAGRLTEDVDPPGFELFGGFVPGMRSVPPADRGPRAGSPRGVVVAGGSTGAKRKHPPTIAGGTDLTTTNTRQVAEMRKAKIAAAKVSLQKAKRSQTAALSRAQSLAAAQKKADAEAKQAEKLRRDAEEKFEKATAAAEDAARRARDVALEVEDSAGAVEDAELTVEEATKELESLSNY